MGIAFTPSQPSTSTQGNRGDSGPAGGRAHLSPAEQTAFDNVIQESASKKMEFGADDDSQAAKMLYLKTPEDKAATGPQTEAALRWATHVNAQDPEAVQVFLDRLRFSDPKAYDTISNHLGIQAKGEMQFGGDADSQSAKRLYRKISTDKAADSATTEGALRWAQNVNGKDPAAVQAFLEKTQKTDPSAYDYISNYLGIQAQSEVAQPGGLAGRKTAVLAAKVVNSGSEDDGFANREELTRGFAQNGKKVEIDGDTFDRVISVYGTRGDGTLSAAELKNAINDGVIQLSDGKDAVKVDALALKGMTPEGTANLALRVTKAGSGDDRWLNVAELGKGLTVAGFHGYLETKDVKWLLDTYGDKNLGAISNVQLTRALDEQALKIDATGGVSIDTAVNAPRPTPERTPRAKTRSAASEAYRFPPNPSKEQLDTLASEIRADIKSNSGRSEHDVSIYVPTSLTPLQTKLLTAINGIPPEVRAGNADLTAAINEALATPGGQQMATTVNRLEPALEGDLLDPHTFEKVSWTSPLTGKTVANVLFNVDKNLPEGTEAAVAEWVDGVRRHGADKQLDYLLNGKPIKVVKGNPKNGKAFEVDLKNRTLTLRDNASPQDVIAGLRDMIGQSVKTSPLRNLRDFLKTIAKKDQGAALVDKTLVFDSSVPLEAQRKVKAIADNSQTFRNMLIKSYESGGQYRVKMSDDMQFGGNIDFQEKVIRISRNPEPGVDFAASSASTVVFEVSNAAGKDLLVDAMKNPTDFNFSDQQVDDLSVELFQASARESIHSRLNFQDWCVKEDKWPPGPFNEAPAKVLGDPDLVLEYLHSQFGESRVRAAARTAYSVDAQETSSAIFHDRTFAEVEAGFSKNKGKLSGKFGDSLVESEAKKLRAYEYGIKKDWATGNYLGSALDEQIRNGHTAYYFAHELPGLDTPADPALNGSDSDSASLNGDLHDTASDAGSQIRVNAQQEARELGPEGLVKVKADVEEKIWNASEALAKKMVASPRVMAALKATGKGAVAIQAGLMVKQLTDAIHEDIVKGDHKAHATRRVVAELEGGLIGGAAGGALGLAAGAAIGTTIFPVVGTAIGAFVGELLGMAGGFWAGSKAGDLAYDATADSVDSLIDELFPQQAR